MEEQAKQLLDLLTELLPENLPPDLRPEYRRRLEIVLRSSMGQSQATISAALGCSQETVRYWMTITQMGKAKTWHSQPLGRTKRINQEYLSRLKVLVNHSPKDYGYCFERWTAGVLGKHLNKELGIEISDRHVNRLLKQMGLSTRSCLQSAGKSTHSPKNQHKITIGDLYPSSLESDDR